MAKKKQKKKEQKTTEGKIELSQTISDVKTFIEKFKSDVERKRKEYQSYAQKLQKKKP